jgi:acyl-CoA hydrolase
MRVGFMGAYDCGAANSTQKRQGRLHLVARVRIAGLLRDNDAVREQLARLRNAAEARQELAELSVTGHVIRMRVQELLEMFRGGGIVAELDAFESQPIACEGVRGFFGDELLEHFAARLLSLGHGLKARIITGLSTRAKRARALRMRRTPFRMAKREKKKATVEKSRGPVAHGQGKPVSASSSEFVEAVLPNDANPLGNMLGGRVMHLIDMAGALAAHRHSNSIVVTASVDYLDFRFPIRVGEWIVLKSSVNRVFHTSMEVGVKVFSENILTGERKHTSSAYVTYVAIDQNREPHPVPPLILETEEDRRRFREAGERRRYRLAMRHKPLSIES